MSFVGLVLAPGILVIVANDYRNIISDSIAGIGIEDLLFSFSLFGIAAVIYQIAVGQHTHKFRGVRYKMTHPAFHWYVHLIIILGLWMFTSLLLIEIFELASIRALIVGVFVVGIHTIADRKDLLLDALLSGFLTAVLVFLSEQIFFARLFPDVVENFWRFDQMNLFLIGGVPVEELIWAAMVGFTIGPLYEWLKRYQLK
ncbi:hypothetical protein HY798_01410 [Candidatus Falkowbacteria bacterium]|nr:hypothetical protein [Candidatus Falkowbacteria bacterium]